MQEPKLEVRHVSKSFRRGSAGIVQVLQDLSLEVANLEFLVLLGPSGCGKSTLLRIIDGLIPCDTGSIFLNGKDVTGQAGHGRGMVFQTFDLFPWRTAVGNVEFGLEVQGLPKAERPEVSRHYINLVGLSGFEDALPHELSGGMQQRVGIARAFAIRPEVLLMDEPFGALDVQTRDILQDELLRIWEQEQKTVIFVTHSIEEALLLADRVVAMTARPGRVKAVLPVTLPRPRDDGAPAFVALKRQLGELLQHEVAEA